MPQNDPSISSLPLYAKHGAFCAVQCESAAAGTVGGLQGCQTTRRGRSPAPGVADIAVLVHLASLIDVTEVVAQRLSGGVGKADNQALWIFRRMQPRGGDVAEGGKAALYPTSWDRQIHCCPSVRSQARAWLTISLGEIPDVNVISDAGAVRGRIVDTEDFEMRPPAVDNLAGNFDEMGGDGATLSAATHIAQIPRTVQWNGANTGGAAKRAALTARRIKSIGGSQQNLSFGNARSALVI